MVQRLVLILPLGLIFPGGSAPGADCNSNGIPDEVDIVGSFSAHAAVPSPLGLEPRSLAAGDLDMDGDPDLVLVDRATERILTAANRGNGTFDPPVALSAPAELALTADLDEDGDPDLAAFLPDGRVVAHRNEGGFVFREGSSASAGEDPTAAAAGDIDRDGDIDLVVASGAAREIAVIENDGEGGLRAIRIAGTDESPSAVVLADLDGDSRVDIVVACEGACCPFRNGTLLLLGQNDDGSFERRGSLPVEGDVLGVAAADLEGDGDMDLVATRFGDPVDHGGISVFRNSGGGRGALDGGLFAPAEPLAAGRNPHAVLAADLNADGWADLILSGVNAAHAASTVVVLLGGNEGFGVPAEYSPAGRARDIAAADFDGDGLIDIITSSPISSVLSLVRGRGDGTLSAARTYSTFDVTRSAEAADLDRDGVLDMILAHAGTSGPDVTVLEGIGAGYFIPTGSNLRLNDYAARRAPIADMDRDGSPDVLVMDSDVIVFRNNGRGGYSSRADVLIQGRLHDMVIQDFDKDGDLDFAAPRQTSEDPSYLVVVLNEGNLQFAAPVAYPMGNFPVAIAAADFDRDGNIDLVVPHEANGVNTGDFRGHIFRGVGNGSFVELTALELPALPSAAAAGDFDADGDGDVAISSHETGSVTFFRSRGDGSFDAGIEIPVGEGPSALAAGDLDGDGRIDLASANRVSGTISVLLNRGSAGFAPRVDLPIGMAPASLFLTDMDLDGQLDFLTAHTISNRFSILLNASTPAGSSDADRNGVPDECDAPARSPFVRGDVDEDGRVAVADAIVSLNHLFGGGPRPPCGAAADLDDDGRIWLTDPLALVRHLFQGGDPPPPPHGACGVDPTPDDLGCARFSGCP